MVFVTCSDSFGKSHEKVTSILKDSRVNLVQPESFRASTMAQLIDSIFISHGAPTYAIDPGLPGKALEDVGQQLIAQKRNVARLGAQLEALSVQSVLFLHHHD